MKYKCDSLPQIATYLATDWTSATVLALVCRILHAGCHQAVASEQMSLKTLVCEESELTLLTI